MRGQSIIEILFAIAIFTIGVVTIGFLVFDAQTSLRNAREETHASLLAREGLMAVRTIRDDDFDNLNAGTYGLVLQDNRWELDSEPDTTGKFTRTVSIEDIDLETKTVTSTVSWEFSDVRPKEVTYVTRFTDWQQTRGDAEVLEVDTAAAALVLGIDLTGITLTNTDAEDITITGMTLQWNGGSQLNNIVIDATSVYLAATSSGATSGEFIDIDDYTLTSGSGIHTLSSVLFDADTSETDFILMFILSDGSRRHVVVEL